MQIIDAFRFPVTKADESSLFHYQYFSSSIEMDAGIQQALWVNFDVSDESFNFTKQSAYKNWLLLLSADRDVLEKQLSAVTTSKIKGYVIHPYLQNITRENFTQYKEVIKRVNDLGCPLVICTAFGGPQLYKISPLEFTAFVAEIFTNTIVLSHAGGAKIIDALLLADVYSNIILDTSFSLSYWKNSSIEKDMAFAFKKLGDKKVMFGSDAPFCSQRNAVQDCFDFIKKYQFSDTFIESILSLNTQRVYGM